MIPDKIKVLGKLHRLHNHHHRQDREDRLACRKAAHWSKKSQRVARKMSKLEEKLRRYKDNCSALVVDLDEDGNEVEALSSSSINNDDAPLERADRRHHRHHHHHRRRGDGRDHRRNDSAASCSADNGDSSDSSSSSSDSDSDDSKSAGSSRSVSPRQRRRRHQHPHHHHHHQRHQRRGKPSDTANRDAQDDDGIYGCVYRILSRSEPSLHDESTDAAAAAAVGESQSAVVAESPVVVVDLEAHSYCTARDDDDGDSVAPAQLLQDCETMNEDEEIEDVDDFVLEDGWKKIVLEGLPAEEKAALTSKYSVAKRAHILQAPRLNPELRLVAGPRALERDQLLASQQSQLGSGLKALARGLASLRGCTEIEKNPSVVEALGQLEDASRLLLDAHRDASRARRLEMRADLRHEARDALDGAATNDEDGWLFGGEATAARLKDLRCFKKCQRREERREARSEKGQKRKLAQGRAAESKRTTTSGDNSSSSKKQLDNLAELSIKNS
ncbi:uncharacterized protein LOC106653966 [Trichogramma pretiosum]|uniref:uncharacterized protein LOC106653966 n=1 Tax=Trichogramma pretiosum TaxID=7493 RepID=UPI0006C982C7|nr:uncharacterized protein LOC106653966 [Trichogramma pretiosum]